MKKSLLVSLIAVSVLALTACSSASASSAAVTAETETSRKTEEATTKTKEEITKEKETAGKNQEEKTTAQDQEKQTKEATAGMAATAETAESSVSAVAENNTETETAAVLKRDDYVSDENKTDKNIVKTEEKTEEATTQKNDDGYGHTHVWVAETVTEPVYETVHHDAVTHEEPVYEEVWQDEITHMEPLYYTNFVYGDTYPVHVCVACGEEFTDLSELSDHIWGVHGGTSTRTEYRTPLLYTEELIYDYYEVVDQEAGYVTVQTGTKTVVDTPAYDETVQTGTREVTTYRCSVCGAEK